MLTEAGSVFSLLVLVGAVLCSFIQLQQGPLNQKVDKLDGKLERLDGKLERLSLDLSQVMQKQEQHGTILTELRVSVAELNVKVMK